jgi:spermidine synthase
VTYGLPAALCYLLVDRPLRFGLGVGAVFLAAAFGASFLDRAVQVLPMTQALRQDLRAVIQNRLPESQVHAERSFFGVLRVTDDSTGSYRSLVHGSTLHGRQRLNVPEGERRIAIEYYHPEGPIGQVVAAVSGRAAKQQIAVLGLGTGAMAYYAQPDREVTFFEIDPAVPPITQTYFSYLRESPILPRIVMGDARLSLARDDRVYDIILADAFSSDAIPIHLMTLEAVRDVYLPRLSNDGILIFHISNRYLDLEPVLSDVADAAGLIGRHQSDSKDDEKDKAASSVVILARSDAALGPLAQDPRWEPLPEPSGKHVWTDDFSNILGVFNFSLREELGNLWGRIRGR